MPETKEKTETEESEAAAVKTENDAAKAEEKPEKKPAKKRGRAKKVAAEPEVVPWEELMAGFDEAEVKDYSMKESFSKGEYIKHVKFGLGKVTGVIESSKVKVVFETGLKVLIQNR